MGGGVIDIISPEVVVAARENIFVFSIATQK